MRRMAPTLAERLGFSASDRVAVVHADDIGMCHAANEGAFEALGRGLVTCGSIMVPCPWFREAADRARSDPRLDLGIHLTLNSEWPHYRWGPVAGRARVPSLLDDQGFLPRTTLDTVKRARPEEVEIELRAQIDMALAAGIDVTHFDSHMGTVFFPPFVDIYVKLARDYRIPVFAVRPEKQALERAGLSAAEPILRRVAETLEAAGFPLLDAVDADSLGFAPGDGEAHTQRRLERLGRGVSYWIIHPAKDGEELRAISPDAHARAFEHGFYGGPPGRTAFARAGVKTVGMRALRQLLQA
jgi:predicted glycoside hydrolase/deacetylase ChbG (UPF0249 family)